MSVERPDFLDAYNAVEVPAPLLSEDAVDEHVSATVAAFFDTISNSLDLGNRTLGDFFEFDYKMIIPQLYESEDTSRESDEYLQSFRKKGSQVLASVLYVRDDFNYQIAHFTKFPLLSETAAQIRELQRFERIEHGLE